MKTVLGKVNSIQSLGTLDGPGVRFVVFMQGCNLRCGCCHNPDTWDINLGTDYSPTQILNKVLNYKEYFKNTGGITISGGEPLLQPEFVTEVFKLCKENGINTCLDTSGSILNDKVKKLLKYTDLVLLDIKYTDDSLYQKYVGCSIDKPLEFLKYLESVNIKTILRQVIIPSLNDDESNILKLKNIANSHKNVLKTELLGFKKMCKTKYDNLNIEFKFKDYREPTQTQMQALQKTINTD